MSKRLELCLVFFVGCTLNASPIHDGSKSVDHSSDDSSRTGSISNAETREDAGVRDAATAEGGPISTGSAGSDADDTSTMPDASMNEPAGGAPSMPDNTSTTPARNPPKAAAAAGQGGSAAGMGETASGRDAGGAGAGGAGPEDAGATNLRGSLIDQVFNAFEARGEGTVESYMLLNDLRRMAVTGEDLSAPFVLSLLNAVKKAGLCLADRQSCAQICATIGQDCKQCAEDATCKSALTEVCGPVIAGCFFGQ
jgi:hypothetical protein